MTDWVRQLLAEASIVLLAATVGGILGAMWTERRAWQRGYDAARKRGIAERMDVLQNMTAPAANEYIAVQRERARRIR